jgi:calcium-dependent protein kinase
VHRDIKPENILFSTAGDYNTLKLIDFGLSTQNLAKEKKSVGSPYYMAPEIIDGSFSFKTDIWSVGVILYVLMTGKQPFIGASQDEVFYAIKNSNYKEKYLNDSNCSIEAKDLISKLLIKDENKRYSVEEALNHKWFKKWPKIEKDKRSRNKSELLVKETSSESENNAPLLENNIIDSIKTFNKNNTFHKEVLFYMAKISKDEEISRLKEIFFHLDKDNTGTLTFDEILKAFQEIGLNIKKVNYLTYY